MEQSVSMSAARSPGNHVPTIGRLLVPIVVGVTLVTGCGQSINSTAVRQACDQLKQALPGWTGGTLSPAYAPHVLAAVEGADSSHDGKLSSALHHLRSGLLLPVSPASESTVETARSAAYAECGRRGFPVTG
jgi:hypothetical protein